MAEEKARFDELLKTFSPTQLDFIAVRMTAKSDKEAAETIGISPDVVYAWPDKQAVNEAVRLAKQNGVSVAREKLARLASKAVDTVEAAMGDREHPGLAAALAVLDRVGLPEVKRQEMTGSGEVTITVVRSDD
jgi:hypothetical protein